MSPKGPPSIFLMFCNKLDFQKVERVPPYTIFKTLRFLILRYSVDFRRSRLVSIEQHKRRLGKTTFSNSILLATSVSLGNLLIFDLKNSNAGS